MKKCCVGGCGATSNTNRLFSFPKNTKLKNLWMSFLVPTNSLLIGLTNEQLANMRVCDRHFDKVQFDSKGNRLRYSYPCLFSNNELTHGVPLAEGQEKIDHNYCKVDDDENDNEDSSLSLVVIRNPDCEDHRYLESSKLNKTERESPAKASEVIKLKRKNVLQDINLEQPSCSSTKKFKVNLILENEEKSPAQSVNKLPNVLQKQEVNLEPPSCSSTKELEVNATVTNKGPCLKRRKKFIKHIKELANESIGLPGSQRLTQALTCARNEKIFSNFHALSKQAQSFLTMQLRLCRKNKMARRFTLDEKLIALALMKQSPKGYKLLENMFALPNKRTLHRLSEKIMIEPGLNPQIFENLKNKVSKWCTKEKLCTIVFDEISLTPHLTYSEKYDKIIGFVDEAGDRKARFCDHALVFMLRGICSSWRQSIAFYFCEGTISSAALQNILKQLVAQVTLTGLIPLGLVCDQGSTFRTAIKKMREDTVQQRNILGTPDDGTVNIAETDLSIFYDPPHLLKGIRNNFLTKNIIWDGKIATWKDIEFIFDLDSKLGHTRALPKLTARHVVPDKIKKMKVSIATQVLSARTAAMLKYTNALNVFHDSKTADTMATTAEVVEFFDSLFDSVNGYPGGSKPGKFRKAIKQSSGHFEFWADAIKKLKIMKFEVINNKHATQARNPRFVRVPSLDGWITTLESFIRVTKLLFQKYELNYYYPRHINQDPLENFFGRIRALNYRNNNPDANAFIYSFKSLMLSSLLSPHSKSSNCEVDKGEYILDIKNIFKSGNDNKENDENVSRPSTSQDHKSSKPFSKSDVINEKIKVHCSAYTAGYICRKMTKKIKCKNCAKTYIGSPDENINKLIRYREYKTLKRNNLAYPNSKFLILYREASNCIHEYLNKNCEKNEISKNIQKNIEKLTLTWLGCKHHCQILRKTFIKLVVRLHVHNWCNIINKILKGQIQEKYVSGMGLLQCLAFKKHCSFFLRKKVLNK